MLESIRGLIGPARRWKYAMTIALVTGANKGVGLSVARALGQKGIRVWLGGRVESRGTAAAARLRAECIDVEFLHLDVADEASISAGAKHTAAPSGLLDILVNNAGVMVEMQETYPQALNPSEVPMAWLREQYDTNFFGAVAMIQTMLPLLRKSAAGRIVNVTACMGAFAYKTDRTRQPEPLKPDRL
jgi:NAD(P)-dependent dehydrogenase (short-subunit alcohol dehydrogenase family)